MAMRVTAETLQEGWPVYRAATQMQAGEPVLVRTIRAPNDQEMRQLLKRISQVQKISEFHFIEVHKYDPNYQQQTTVVIGNINAPYPTEDEELDLDVYSVSPRVVDGTEFERLISKVDVDEEWPAPEEEKVSSLPLFNYELAVA